MTVRCCWRYERFSFSLADSPADQCGGWARRDAGLLYVVWRAGRSRHPAVGGWRLVAVTGWRWAVGWRQGSRSTTRGFFVSPETAPYGRPSGPAVRRQPPPAHPSTSASQQDIFQAKTGLIGATSVLRFLQLLCEGHYLQLQDYLRDQGAGSSVNIPDEIMKFLDEVWRAHAGAERVGASAPHLAFFWGLCSYV